MPESRFVIKKKKIVASPKRGITEEELSLLSDHLQSHHPHVFSLLQHYTSASFKKTQKKDKKTVEVCVLRHRVPFCLILTLHSFVCHQLFVAHADIAELLWAVFSESLWSAVVPTMVYQDLYDIVIGKAATTIQLHRLEQYAPLIASLIYLVSDVSMCPCIFFCASFLLTMCFVFRLVDHSMRMSLACWNRFYRKLWI